MKSAIQASELSFSIDKKKIYENLDFEIPLDSFFSIIGPNGAGKSFLIKTILGIIRPKIGEIKILSQKPNRKILEEIGYVPQLKSFDRRFPATALELVANGMNSLWPVRLSSEQKDKCLEALKIVRACDLAEKALAELSGGELQRIYLARAFVKTRKVLILDEPLTGIDIMGEADLYRILEDYRQRFKACVVMVTHDVEVAKYHSSHVLLMNKKQISFGKPSESLSADFLGRAFGHSQHDHHHPEHHS